MILWVGLCLLSLYRFKLASDEKIFISGWNTVSTLHYCIRDNILHFNGEIRKYSRLKKFENMFRCFSYCNLHTTMLEASNTLFSKLVSNSEPQWCSFGMCLYDTRSNFDRVQFLIHSTFTARYHVDTVYSNEGLQERERRNRIDLGIIIHLHGGVTSLSLRRSHVNTVYSKKELQERERRNRTELGLILGLQGGNTSVFFAESWKHCVLKFWATREGKKKLQRVHFGSKLARSSIM